MNAIAVDLSIKYQKEEDGSYSNIHLECLENSNEHIELIDVINCELYVLSTLKQHLDYILSQKKELDALQQLEEIKTSYEMQLQSIRRELLDKNKYMEQLRQLHEEEMQLTRIKFTQSILNLNSTLDIRIADEVRHVEEKYKLKEQFYQTTIQDMKDHADQFTKIQQENEAILSILKQPKYAADIGAQGEQSVKIWLYDFIQYNPNAKIEDVSGSNASGDIRLSYHAMQCCIEVKNIKESIGDTHIEKFYRDVQDTKNNYNCGILVSIRSGFTIRSSIEDMELKIIDNRPVIFLSNVEQNKDKLIMSIQILHRLVNLLCSDQTYAASHLVDRFKFQLRQLCMMETQMKMIKQSSKELEAIIQQSKKNIHETLHLDEYAHTKVDLIHTPCGKAYKGMTKNYKKHMEICLQCKECKEYKECKDDNHNDHNDILKL